MVIPRARTLTTILVSITVTTAYGAPSSGESSAATDSSSEAGLQEVVVTAQKRSENLQQTPLAVSAVTLKDLAAANITNEEQLQNLIPGLQVTHGGLNAVVFLRGIGNNSGTPGNEPAISTYVDGVYHPSPIASIFTFQNVERIEVLKGPQGTLFGRNATGGVINIVTADPSFEPTLRANIGYASYDTVSAGAYVSAGVAQQFAGDLGVSYSHQDHGWGTNIFDGSGAYFNNNLDLRSKLMFTPSDATTIRLVFDYDATRNDQGANYTVTPGTTSNTGVAHAGGFYDIDSNIDPNNHIKQYGAAATVEQDFSWARLASISSWRYADGTLIQNADATYLPTAKFTARQRERTVTQEMNLQAPREGAFQWIGGLYFFSDNARYAPLTQTGTAFGSPTGGISTFAEQQTYSYAAYAQATAPLWRDDTHLTVGVRYTDDERSANGYRFAVPSGSHVALRFPAGYPSTTWAGKTTYKAAVDHDLTSDIMVYASVSTGFKSGNYNLATITQLPTQAATLTAYEAGAKTEWLDHKLRFNAAGYHYDFNNLQVQAYTQAGPVQTNAATAKFNGFDAELVAVPVSRLQLTASVNYTDAHYSKFPAAVCINRLPNGLYSGSVTCDATGNKVALVDPFTAAFSVQYALPVAGGDLSIEADVSHQSSYYFDVQNSINQSAYNLLGASLSWAPAGQQWSVMVFGKNLTASEYYANRTLTGGLGDAYTAAPPRTVGVKFMVSH